MKTESDLNKDILKIIADIKRRFPELLKYIEEVPVTIPNNISPEINVKILTDYYNSLNEMRSDYALSHESGTNKPTWKRI